MNHPSVGERFLRFATRTAVRILPKEAKLLVRKYNKLRKGKNKKSIKSQEEIVVVKDMSQKSSKKKSQKKLVTEVPITEAVPPAVKEELVEQFRKMSLEGGSTDTSHISKNETKASSATPDGKVEMKNDKTRFQKYNIRLEDIIKFREKLSELEIKQLSLPPVWSKTIDDVDNRARNEVQKARDEAADAQIKANNLQDQLDETLGLLRSANAKNEKYTKEAESQRKDYAQLQQQLSEVQASLKETYEKCGDLENHAQEQDKNLQDTKDKYIQERDAKTKLEHALKQLEADAARQIQLKDGELSQTVVEHRIQLQNKNDEIANMIEEIRQIDANYKQSLAKKVVDLEAVYASRYSEHQQQLNSVQNEIKDREKEIETFKTQLQEAYGRIATLEKENAVLKAALENSQKSENDLKELIADIKRDLEKVRQSYQDANSELRDKEIKFIVEDLEPEFIKYDGLLMLEEKRIDGIRHRQQSVDANNN